MATHVFRKRKAQWYGEEGLFPADERGQEAVQKIPNGTDVKAEIKRERNLQHLRLYWTIIYKLYRNQEYYASPEMLSDAFKVCAGLCTTFVLPSGTVVHRAGSIATGNMDQGDFDEFWARFVRVVCEKVLPNVNRQDLENDVFSMINGSGNDQ